MRGILVTFEGIEGSGKTTLVSGVADALRQAGHNPVVTREPGGTDLGLALRKILLDPGGARLDSIAELMLFGADRAQHVTELIIPALEAGLVVLCDRFSDATRVYQGFGRRIDLKTVETVDNAANKGAHPDLTVLLDLPVETGLTRVGNRNLKSGELSESRIDEEKLAFHRAVREGYLMLARQEPERFLVLDAELTPLELAGVVMKEMKKRFANVF